MLAFKRNYPTVFQSGYAILLYYIFHIACNTFPLVAYEPCRPFANSPAFGINTMLIYSVVPQCHPTLESCWVGVSLPHEEASHVKAKVGGGDS